MKLLIVDDETHVRNGIIGRLDFKKLGIDSVGDAKNGLDGLAKARSFSPDIVLTDVRMPHMNGTEMAFELRKLCPDCSIIFMSGYSDKEYLKDAISLKAISYIEKPIEINELASALSEAIELQSLNLQRKEAALEQQKKLALTMDAYENELLISMTKKGYHFVEHIDTIHKVFPDFSLTHAYTVCIIEVLSIKDIGKTAGGNVLSSLKKRISDYYRTSNQTVYVAKKEDNYLLCLFCLGPYGTDKTALPEKDLSDGIRQLLTPTCYFLVAFGNVVPDATSIYLSYNNASSALLASFFYEYDSVIIYERLSPKSYSFSESTLTDFHELLKLGNYNIAVEYITGLFAEMKQYPNTFVYTLRNFLCSMYVDLHTMAREHHIMSLISDGSDDILRRHLYKMRFLSQIETEFIEKLQIYYEEYHPASMKNAVANQVKYYIHTHYSEPDLSLSTIAQHLSISSAYLCSIFKREEGVTLTHYITDYRIERAKILLLNPTFRIKDVAWMTGYSDCNYFIKLFKKRESVTPAEFRKSL